MDYEPIWELYADWSRRGGNLSELELDNFTLLNFDISWEDKIFTFHIALLGVHFGRSVKVRL